MQNMSDPKAVPTHVAVIPDGNRRWAEAHHKTTIEGHRIGYENLKRVADAAFERGVQVVSGYVFSTENWGRASDEVKGLLNMAAWAIKEEAGEYQRKNIRIHISGSPEGLEPKLAAGLDELQRDTKDNTAGTINICFNYGGRRDIIEAVNRLIGQGKVKQIDEASLASQLSTAGLPDPDLIIRTSGEQRLSNYLLWEGAYSELYFSEVLWPDFGIEQLEAALTEYAHRKRRFGK
jgi:undecaprenyl diphosphate synthase